MDFYNWNSRRGLQLSIVNPNRGYLVVFQVFPVYCVGAKFAPGRPGRVSRNNVFFPAIFACDNLKRVCVPSGRKRAPCP